MHHSISLIIALTCILYSGLATAQQKIDAVVVGGYIEKPGPYPVLPAQESLAELLNRIGGIPVTPSDYLRYRDGSPLFHIRISLSRDGKVQILKVDPNSEQLWKIFIRLGDSVEIIRKASLMDNDYSSVLMLKKPRSEQAATGDGDKPAN